MGLQKTHLTKIDSSSSKAGREVSAGLKVDREKFLRHEEAKCEVAIVISMVKLGNARDTELENSFNQPSNQATAP